MKCFDILTGKILHRRTVTQLPWPQDNDLIRKVEAWGKKGACVIQRDSIEFRNRKGEKFDWENDDLPIYLEVANEQPKMTDPGVADIYVDDDDEEELGGEDAPKEKPSCVTRAVSARRRAGLDREPEPCKARGVEVRTADEVIVIDNDEDTVQVEVPVEQVPPLSIKLELGDIPKDIEEETEGPHRSTRTRTQRKLLSPKKTGKSHDAVGFAETEGDFGEQDHQTEDSILARLTEELNTLNTEANKGFKQDDELDSENKDKLAGSKDLELKL